MLSRKVLTWYANNNADEPAPFAPQSSYALYSWSGLYDLANTFLACPLRKGFFSAKSQ